MDALLQDLRYAVRTLRRSAGFAAVAILSLALGIGANTTIFTVANAFLLRPVDAADPQRIVRLYHTHHSPFSYDDYRYFREQARVFSGVIGERLAQVGVRSGDHTERATAELVSGDFFTILGVGAARGRTLIADDDRAPAPSTAVVLSHRYWTRRFGADPSIVGRTIALNDRPFTVVGVAREGFLGSIFAWTPDVWVTLAAAPELLGVDLHQWGGSIYVTARLAPGVSFAQAQAAMSTLAPRLRQENPETHKNFSVRLDGARGVGAEFRTPVTVAAAFLMTVVGLVLLLACTNVANLLLARATTRRREIGIRLAIGASRGRLVRQLLTESVLLALAGGAVGLLLALGATQLIARFIPADAPVVLDLRPDLRVLGFTALLAVLTGVVFGLAPALRASRPDLVPALKDTGSAAGYRKSRLRNGLVVSQVTLCTLLLIGALLFLRSLGEARVIDPGFDPAPTLDVAVDVGLRQYDEARGRDFYRRLLERVEAIPGVRSATLAQLVPLTGSNQETGVQLEGAEPPADGRRPKSYFNYVAPGYFSTLGIALARGRDFTANDRESAPGVVIVNEEAARRLWPGADALGKRLSLNGTEGPYLEVIGIARISKYNTLGESAQPFMYVPFLQSYQSEMVLHVRAAGGDPRPLAAPVRDAVQTLDPALPIGDVKLLADEIRFALIPARAGATLLGAFGGLALLLATVGIYGVTSYAVAQRTREIGIRGALGADGHRVIGMVIGECMRLAAIGVAIGLGLAFAVTRVAAGVLYGVSPTDPATFAGTALLLLAVSALASFIPARRASRVDPMVALRSE